MDTLIMAARIAELEEEKAELATSLEIAKRTVDVWHRATMHFIHLTEKLVEDENTDTEVRVKAFGDTVKFFGYDGTVAGPVRVVKRLRVEYDRQQASATSIETSIAAIRTRIPASPV